MCGIAGVAGPLARDLDAERVQRLLRAIAHRGPDAFGVWRGVDVALGHTRLSIRDLSSTGSQPMHSASGNSTIVYNGELYALDDIASQLSASGIKLRGSSDTEVVLELLELRGHSALSGLNGMYGLGYWSHQRRELLLARDHAGIKPVYYAVAQGSLVFASELKPILEFEAVDRSLDRTALSHFLSLGFVPAPWTVFRSIRQLLPGEVLIFSQARGIRVERPARRIGDPVSSPPLSYSAARDRLGDLVSSAARDQLVADVPIGVLLSGGVDSSVVAAAAARQSGRIRTFTVVHDDPRYDEREPARAVARHIGSEHFEVQMPKNGLTMDELESLIDHHGDPFADSSSLPTRRLAREVRRHVKVALSGDGGDELFCGYPRYSIGDAIHRVARAPSRLRSSAVSALSIVNRHLPQSGLRTRTRQISRALALASRPPPERAVGTISFFWPEEQRSLLMPQFHAEPEALSSLILERSPANLEPDMSDGCHRMEQHLVLPDDMLTKVDRMTMAESLEIRPVLLDSRITEFATGLAIGHKLRGDEGKSVLKAVAREWLPAWVIDRPKMGFAVPLLDFGGKVLADMTRWSLESTDSPLATLFSLEGRMALGREFERRGDGVDPEDSAFRRSQRQWAVAVLALSLHRLRATL
jgi:asparagine synthase (glutamine-hydrolysing)